MKRKRLIFHLFPSYLVITLLAILALSWYTITSFREYSLNEASVNLNAKAQLIRDQIWRENLLNSKELDSICKKLGKETATRITVVLPSGDVIGDSDEDPSKMNNHADRPEIIEAYNGVTGMSIRYSYTLDQEMMYIAIPILNNDQMVAVIRTSLSLVTLQKTLDKMRFRIISGGFFIALIATLISFIISRRITKPLENIKRGAERFARGEFNQKLQAPDTEEIGGLADALNKMAYQLDERIKTVLNQRNELEAVLASMIEAVIAVDIDGQILRMNRTAGELFEINYNTSQGKSIYEVIRNSDLQNFIQQILNSDKRLETELTAKDHFLQVNGTTLRDADTNRIGALVVMNDITRIKQLEKVRKEFVANVSHELKTPITSIQGFVETLSEGAIYNPNNAGQFLEIIARQTDRLRMIVDDLLELSQIEQGHEEKEIVLLPGLINPVLFSAIQNCQVNADKKQIRLELNCPEDLTTLINPQYLQNAITNLIDNAIKHSEPESIVLVIGEMKDDKIIISVKDSGCGISSEHLPRLFERFYRVDKARSRKEGGTGLGLAIVKHIALAHNGSVAVESEVGKGSKFIIYLPVESEEDLLY